MGLIDNVAPATKNYKGNYFKAESHFYNYVD